MTSNSLTILHFVKRQTLANLFYKKSSSTSEAMILCILTWTVVTSINSFVALAFFFDLSIVTKLNHQVNNVTSANCKIVNFPPRWRTWPTPAWSCSWDRSGSCSTRGWRVLHLPEAGGFSMSLLQTAWTGCVQQISSTSAICTLTTSGKLCQCC